MPWSGKADVARHNKLAAKSKGASRQWLAAANSALKQYGDDGAAIRVANAAVARRKGVRRKSTRNTILER